MKIYTQSLAFLFALAILSSCNNSVEPVATEPENAIENNQFVVSKNLLETTNMAMGNLITHDFYDIVQATGAIEVPASSKADISPMAAGFVSKIPYLVGDKVRKGDLLMQLQNPEFIAMQQAYLEAKAELTYSQSEFDRQKLLMEENISSKKSFQKASSNFKLKQAQYSGLKETLRLLNVDLAQLDAGIFTSTIRIYAPIDGFISNVNASLGTYVAPGNVLLSLINTSHKHLELEVFEKDVLKLENGQKIRFRVTDASKDYFEGTVFQINKAIDMEKRTLLVHGHLAKANNRFLLGMYVEGEILTDKTSAIAVPSRALAIEDGQHYILIFEKESGDDLIFVKTPVKIGLVTEKYTQIVSPVFQAGDKIMDKGVFRLVGN